MKYLSLPEFDDVTNALNFETADCRVVGSCDLYTTKAAGSDKKLYKTIELTLEAQYESSLRFAAALGPTQAKQAAAQLNLNRASPFGSMSLVSSRRTFAYLIATLNASHPDYDFSHLLRPADFKREKSLRRVMNTLDSTLYNLRPRPMSSLNSPRHWSSGVSSTGPPTESGSQAWSPKMWQTIDKEMTLEDCSIYCYSPDDDPYDAEEGGIWSFNYFFFNKARKRVCYIYLRGLSILSHSPPRAPFFTKRTAEEDWSDWSDSGSGARKRAKYWLGDRATGTFTGSWDEDHDDNVELAWEDEDYEEPVLLKYEQRYVTSADDAPSPSSGRSQSKSTMRGISEDIAESMEI